MWCLLSLEQREHVSGTPTQLLDLPGTMCRIAVPDTRMAMLERWMHAGCLCRLHRPCGRFDERASHIASVARL
eukprot:7386217-Prymnesium_polylepis.1